MYISAIVSRKIAINKSDATSQKNTNVYKYFEGLYY